MENYMFHAELGCGCFWKEARPPTAPGANDGNAGRGGMPARATLEFTDGAMSGDDMMDDPCSLILRRRSASHFCTLSSLRNTAANV